MSAFRASDIRGQVVLRRLIPLRSRAVDLRVLMAANVSAVHDVPEPGEARRRHVRRASLRNCMEVPAVASRAAQARRSVK
jgi:hypothetical protein